MMDSPRSFDVVDSDIILNKKEDGIKKRQKKTLIQQKSREYNLNELALDQSGYSQGVGLMTPDSSKQNQLFSLATDYQKETLPNLNMTDYDEDGNDIHGSSLKKATPFIDQLRNGHEDKNELENNPKKKKKKKKSKAKIEDDVEVEIEIEEPENKEKQKKKKKKKLSKLPIELDDEDENQEIQKIEHPPKPKKKKKSKVKLEDMMDPSLHQKQTQLSEKESEQQKEPLEKKKSKKSKKKNRPATINELSDEEEEKVTARKKDGEAQQLDLNFQIDVRDEDEIGRKNSNHLIELETHPHRGQVNLNEQTHSNPEIGPTLKDIESASQNSIEKKDGLNARTGEPEENDTPDMIVAIDPTNDELEFEEDTQERNQKFAKLYGADDIAGKQSERMQLKKDDNSSKEGDKE